MNEKLYSDYEALIINYINKVVENKAVAEDLCHDTYVDFLTKFENPDTNGRGLCAPMANDNCKE